MIYNIIKEVCQDKENTQENRNLVANQIVNKLSKILKEREIIERDRKERK